MIITSDTLQVKASGQRIFDFLSDFSNFGQLLPEQVKNWEASPEDCSFAIEGLATISLKMGEKIPISHISYLSTGKTPVSFSLAFDIGDKGGELSDYQVSLSTELNPMLEMMARRPLQNFIDILAKKLGEIMEMPRH